LLTYVGFSDLIASRLLAIFYSTLATYLVIRIAKANERDNRVFKVAIVIISFIPTVFLWSSIGLRESFLYLEISAILYSYSRLKNRIDGKNILILGFAIFSLAMTKNYIYILFLFATLITLAIFAIVNRKNFIHHLLVLSLTLLPLAFNPTLIPAISSYLNSQIGKVDAIEMGDINNDGRCDSFEPCAESNGNANGNENQNEIRDENGNVRPIGFVATGGVTLHSLLNQLESSPNSIVSKVANFLGITAKLKSISTSSIVLETDKKVSQNVKQLSLQQAGLKKPDQVLKSSAKFLLVPFIFIDNGSLFLNIQSIETPLWLFVYGLFFVGLYQVIRRRREFDYAVMIATLFALEFVAISALTEVNVGTALRHRSLLLIPILVIWVARKKTEVKKTN
jgi:NADH:ubiquinone oxidoreductase subunit K